MNKEQNSRAVVSTASNTAGKVEVQSSTDKKMAGSELELPQRFTKNGRKRAISFPLKLMKVLSNEKFAHIITWMPGGRSFVIIRPKAFVDEILPKYFKSAQYASFTRKLHRWGFQRIEEGTGVFFHKDFRKDQVDLAEKMTCQHFGLSSPKANTNIGLQELNRNTRFSTLNYRAVASAMPPFLLSATHNKEVAVPAVALPIQNSGKERAIDLNSVRAVEMETVRLQEQALAVAMSQRKAALAELFELQTCLAAAQRLRAERERQKNLMLLGLDDTRRANLSLGLLGLSSHQATSGGIGFGTPFMLPGQIQRIANIQGAKTA